MYFLLAGYMPDIYGRHVVGAFFFYFPHTSWPTYRPILLSYLHISMISQMGIHLGYLSSAIVCGMAYTYAVQL